MWLYTLHKWKRRLIGSRHKRFSLLVKTILFLLCLAGPTWLYADTLSGTVEDQSGAVIVGARIEITGGDLAQPLVLSSDGSGKFSAPDLKPATYSVRVTRDGFEPLVKVVDLHGTLDLRLTLGIARQRVEVTVTGKGLANSDPV